MRRHRAVAAAEKQAVEEMNVYLRTMQAADRSWERHIKGCENTLRRLMAEERHCQEALRQAVMNGAKARFDMLSTDLLATAEHVQTPSLDTLLANRITAAQVTPFSIYALARVTAEPERVDLPPMTLMAELQAGWSILPPYKKAAFEQIAAMYGGYVRKYAPQAPKGKRTRRTTAAAVAPPPPSPPPRPSARQKVREARKAATAAPLDKASAALPGAAAAPLASASSRRRRQPEEWKAAFAKFAKESHAFARQLHSTKGKKVSLKEWMPIAEAEWETKTHREKKKYL